MVEHAPPKPLDFAPSGFFAFRTPLLPIGMLVAWGEGLAAAGASEAELEAAVARDRELLEERLRVIVRDPHVREALFVASPSLDDAISAWLADPKSERAHGVVDIVARYFGRMCARPTPFGLFSGCSMGPLGDDTRLLLAPRAEYQRHTRLDTHYLSALCDALGKSPEVRAKLRFRPSTGLFRSAGQLRYAESRTDEATRERSYSLVSVESTPYLEATLTRAEQGKTVGELAQGLVDDDPQVTLEEASGYLDELVSSQILVSELAPAMTGLEPIDDVVRTLGQIDESLAGRVSSVARELEAMDRDGIGLAQERYKAIATALAELPAKTELPRLFQVDLFKPAPGSTFGGAALRELVRAIGVLSRMGTGGPGRGTSKFREAFRERYEGRTVPLADVLDDERGIASELGVGSSEPSPLLNDIRLPAGEGEGPPLGKHHAWMAQRLARLAARGAKEWALEASDLAELEDGEPTFTADGFSAMATLAARTPEALARGEFKMWLHAVVGPSGANLLGRFCHGDEELTRSVRAQLRGEEALRPQALFAEIVHLPEGRLGNILCRPVLRDHEIHYLGRGGAEAEKQIPIADLRVALEGDRLVLFSERLGREIVPRLTTAHNFSSGSLAMYRFLCGLQSQDGSSLGWSWETLDTAPFLPRVSLGRTVLSLARWILRAEDLKPLGEGSLAARFGAVQALRARLGLPRWIGVADGDNVLPVDLDNVVHADSFAQLVKKRPTSIVQESFPAPEDVLATGPEGGFAHEVVVPFLRTTPRPSSRARGVPRRSSIARTFAPGSEWLYAKMYTGTATVDRVLFEVIAPLVEECIAQGICDGWFFIRYGDPRWHVRVRLHGDAAKLAAVALPRLHALAAPLLADGRMWRLCVDTYEREMERYGGDAGMDACEGLFRTDSDSTLEILRDLSGDEAADARWRLAFRGMHLHLLDLGLTLEERLALMTSVRAGFAAEHHTNGDLEKQLGAKFRKQRAELEWLLATTVEGAAESPLAAGFAALAERSKKSAPHAAILSAAQRDGKLAPPLASIAGSLLHMHANRMLRSEQRAHELVLYDSLMRLYESEVVRGRKKGN